MGYLDIESTGLNANWDYVISYGILSDNGKIYGRVLTRNEVRNPKIIDKELMKEFAKDIQDFDRVVVYWGRDRRHDIPFLRTRCLKWKAHFPLYKDILVTDLYDLVKNKLKLHRNRMQNACEFLGIPSKKHPMNPDQWQAAKLGEAKSLKYIWEHNKEDILSTRELYKVMEPFSSSRKLSI